MDDVEVRPKLAKSYELLAYLACNGNRVTRARLLNALFGGRADESARSYLRQALSGLRQVLPSDAPLIVDSDEIAWNNGGLSTESIDLQATLAQAAALQAADCFDATVAALEKIDGRPYLPRATSQWAEDRRLELEQLIDDARQRAAEAAFDLGLYNQAESLADRILDDDPYRECVWRLTMRLAAAMGNHDRVIARFRGCAAALGRVDISPADATRELLQNLRR